ncbi:type IV pilus modification protein PilV [Saccharophagus degradans]|uniref:Type IV pilus modification protein PilV n=1 Tax=Saccharophagus degradans TaxID=86304 RepID=A0AAW7XAJ4_9GAMM|nr:type IV pilus modification protein PilV [Saccharophagus degradans]MDO6424683.1 type IV pilus modification protein PilV [Saccharophagus degradans]MDO6609016.1 type IV pilus modification protein PilV [Saccharophagus degradans]
MNDFTISNSKGSSLLEVMIALFVLAIGMLGVLAMQTRSIQMNQNAYQYSQATALIADIYEAMLTTPSSHQNYKIAYEETTPAAVACGAATSNCSPSDIAQWNLHHWRTNIETLLPGGQGEIAALPSTVGGYRISVRFVTGYSDATDEPVLGEVALDVSI